MKSAVTFVGLAFVEASSLASASLLNPRQMPLGDTFDWSSIEASPDLKWHDCHEGLRCARLLVPMDWSEHNSTEDLKPDETVSIALVKRPAVVSEKDPSFGGSILYNPGGPGGSATDEILYAGEELQSLFEEDKHFEIIGFDPRGVGATTPPLRCYQHSQDLFDDLTRVMELPPLESGPLALRYHLQMFKGHWDVCLDNSPGSRIIPYATTASVARDMLEIVDKIEASRSRCSNTAITHEAKLQYYGQSYGTYLGATFASMFPDRVGLMLLDSVTDAEEFSTSVLIDDYDDVENTLDVLYQYCFDLGAECPLWQEADRSLSDIKNRVLELLADLDASPVGLGNSDGVGLVTPSPIRLDLLNLAYFFPAMEDYRDVVLQMLADFVSGDFASWLGSDEVELPEDTDGEEEEDTVLPEPKDPTTDDEDAETGYSPSDAAVAIRCVDGYSMDGRHELNISRAEEYVDTMVSRYPTLGSPAAERSLRCFGLPAEFKPKYVFQGPFRAPAPDTASNTTTVAPVLIVNNRLDPVTSLSAAYRLSDLLEGSSVVVQETAGHITTTRAGDCIKDIFRAYFNEGAMPRSGTSCQPGSNDLPALPIGGSSSKRALTLKKRVGDGQKANKLNRKLRRYRAALF